jgi:farnesyl diphosphate synthase
LHGQYGDPRQDSRQGCGRRKPTYVSLMGLERAREFADDLRKQALEALTPFGERRQRLLELTDFITQRKF